MCALLKAYGYPVDGNERAVISVRRSLKRAANYCNISGAEYFPPDADTALIDLAAAEYMLEFGEYSPRWLDMRKDAKLELLKFRRMRW
jgi:hypothetical protein